MGTCGVVLATAAGEHHPVYSYLGFFCLEAPAIARIIQLQTPHCPQLYTTTVVEEVDLRAVRVALGLIDTPSVMPLRTFMMAPI